MCHQTRAVRHGRVVLALVAVAAAFAAFSTGSAFAAACATTLSDSYGAHWDIQSGNADISDGSIDQDGGRTDAYDSFPAATVSTDGGTTWKDYSNVNATGCTIVASGQEVDFPADTTSVPGLEMTRKIYVPNSGLAFARFITFLHNTGASPITLKIDLGGGKNSWNLGSDSGTTVDLTSSGDGGSAAADFASLTTDDNWATTWDGTTGSGADPNLAHNWQFGNTDRASAVGAPNSSPDALFFVFDKTIDPGATVAYMNFEAMRATNADAESIAETLATMPAAAIAGISDAEAAQIANWPVTDRDVDGVPDASDNCPSSANADQADLDKDGIGDACDDDVDGDGLSNVVEAAIGTDPRKADTDGDGKPDGADACPKTAGAGSDGCPVIPPPPPVVLPDTTPPVATVAVSRTISLKALLAKGLVVTVNSNEPSSFAFQIVAAAQGAKLAKIGDLVIATKTLGLGSGKRKVRLTIAKKWRRALRVKSKLTLLTVATDRSGNRTSSSKRLRLKR
jgi:hypothetical protein